MPRSPVTQLQGGIDQAVNEIVVANASLLPDAPNIATIGGGDDSETIRYTGKNDETNTLTGVTRGFDPPDSEQGWDDGTRIARVLTAQDITVMQNALTDLENEKGAADGIATLDSDGNVDQDPREHDNDRHSEDFSTEGWVTDNFNNYVHPDEIQCNANEYSHPNELQCSTGSRDSIDSRSVFPPASHNNTAHSTNYATDNHNNGSHSVDFATDSRVDDEVEELEDKMLVYSLIF